jgi:hypothetical protein
VKHLLSVIFLGLLACGVLAVKPPLKIRLAPHGVVVDVRTLGEKPTSVRRVRLTEVSQERVVWELEAEGRTPQIWQIPLVIGENPAEFRGAPYGTYRVVEPRSSDVFELEEGESYRIEVWGEGLRPAAATFLSEKSGAPVTS